MDGLPRNPPRSPSYILPCIIALAFLSLPALFLSKLDDFVSQTKTVAGHNLEPTPWHLFPPRTFSEDTRQERAYKIIKCSYLTCPYSTRRNSDTELEGRPLFVSSLDTQKCPDFYRFIHKDLQPWAKTRISKDHVMAAKEYAAFRVAIVGGRIYADLYYACVQSRLMFTVWGLLQLLRRYPGMLPDVDMIFDCMDKPSINRTEHGSFPLPLFRYCTTDAHFDIPFPDRSFWGWPETNIKPWDEQFREIKRGFQTKRWGNKLPLAFWKGNHDVDSPIRIELLQCNHSMKWRAQILRQNWVEEAKSGYEQSKLSKQCNHQKNYWPVSPINLCHSIKFAVKWGNIHPLERNRLRQLEKKGQDFMENSSMDRVYDYMFHLISECSKLQDFKPAPPSTALEVCAESLLCLAEPKQREYLERATTAPSPSPPCSLEPANGKFMKSWIEKKKKTIEDVRVMVEKNALRR